MPKLKKIKPEAKNTTVTTAPASHILIQTGEYLAKHMSDFKSAYWSGCARKRQLTLSQIVVAYLCADFGIISEADPVLRDYIKKKEEKT